jgi:uncharacterized membrane protein YedE/YeeE
MPVRLFPRQIVFWSVLLALVVALVLAWASGEWRLTALVVSFLFGFFLQRGSFCGASIISSVVLYKESRGLVGIGLAIFTAMLGFAGLTALGWVVPNPKSMDLLPAIFGGIAFGVGMVLAGGCVSGSLYKAGEGRLNSMLALIGIAIGGNLVSIEFLLQARMAVSMTTAGLAIPASIDQAAGIPFSILATVVGVVGLALFLLLAYRRRNEGGDTKPPLERLITNGWSFAFAGILLGVLSWFAYLSFAASSRNFPLAPTRSVLVFFSLPFGGGTAASWWRGAEALAIIAGSATSAWMRGQLRLRSADPTTLLISLLGGVLAGATAVMAGGCFVGNMLSGWALLSFHSMVFAVFMILGNWVTTIVYLRGVHS